MSGYLSTDRIGTVPAAREARGQGNRPWIGRLWARLLQMRRAAETRRELGQLEPRLLADMGLSRAEAAREADRWPWDLGPSGSAGGSAFRPRQ